MISTGRLFSFLLILCVSFTDISLGQGSSRRPKIELLREIDLEEGRQRLSAFRQMWVEGDFSLKYSLQFIPRRGERLEVKGTLWGSNAQEGPVSLIHIYGEPPQQLLLKNGAFASVAKRMDSRSEWKTVEMAEWFDPVDKEVTLTAFDLMMPFIYWPEWSYEGVTKVRGRAAHAFLMIAPEFLKGNPLDLHGVVVYLDEDFNALLKAEYVKEDEGLIKSFRLLDLKKVDGVWLPKTVDFLNETTRDKTRLEIKEAAVNLDFGGTPLSGGLPPDGVPEIPLSKYQELR